MPDFHPECPKNPKCPPDESQFANGVIWRGVKTPPLTEDHFKSHAELELPNCDKGNCTHWGLSVWVNEDDVQHARRLHRFIRRWHIVAGTVDANDGKIMPTPSINQPGHHTFWKFHDHAIAAKFQIVMQPG